MFIHRSHDPSARSHDLPTGKRFICNDVIKLNMASLVGDFNIFQYCHQWRVVVNSYIDVVQGPDVSNAQ